MKFYSGFSLKNDEKYFKEYRNLSSYSVSGFSYGAIKALQSVQKTLEEGRRVDRLQLFSPAFFQTTSEKFKRLQTMSYKKNKEKYLNNFLKSCFSPYTQKEVMQKETRVEELEELLNFEWSVLQLKNLLQKGVVLEIYLGEKDTIIDVSKAREFFLAFGSVTYIKNANHFLQIN